MTQGRAGRIERAAGPGAYLRVLSRPRAVLPLAAAFVARLPISMAPLGMVLFISDVRGSYASAGLVSGAFAAGAACGSPVWGRLLDRYGRGRVVAPTGVASGLLLAALTVAVPAVSLAVVVGLAAAAGLTFPPIGPAMRASWRVLFPDEATRRAGFVLDAVSVEAVSVGGPLLLSVLLLAGPLVPLSVTAGLLLVGSAAFAVAAPRGSGTTVHPAGTAAGGAGADSGPGRRGRLVTAPGLAPALVVGFAVAVCFGLLDTSLAATARDVLGDERRVGLLFAAIAGGSVTGGLFYGTRRAGRREHGRLRGTLAVFAAGVGALAVLVGAGSPPLGALLPLLVLAGLAVAPSLIILANLVDRFAPTGRVNEAQAWNATASTTGFAAGTAAAGQVIDAGGAGWSFAVAACAVGAAGVVAAGAVRRWDTTPHIR